MVLDTLTELKNTGVLHTGDAMIMVGSMGSLTEEIRLGDTVLPNPCISHHFGYAGRELTQDPLLMSTLLTILEKHSQSVKRYKHGSSYAVFDHHFDHATYKSSLYGDDVEGLDCGEVFVGLEFASRFRIRSGAVLYCSDTPNEHIGDIGTEDFAKRATEMESLLNEVAMQSFN